MMKNRKSLQYITRVSNETGSCLTSQDWQDLGVETISYEVSSLLIKPGFDLLMQLESLNQYTAWPGRLVLNASQLKSNSEGMYTVCSPLDGSRIKHTLHDLLSMMISLNPQMILLPQGMSARAADFLEAIPDSMVVLFSVLDHPVFTTSTSYGVYWNADSLDALHELERYASVPRYVLSDLSFDKLQQFKNLKIDYLESTRPALDAAMGIVYSQDGLIEIISGAAASNFQKIDLYCRCPSCQQGFTQAYLHHLYQHVPLLCQRFLTQHNVHFFQATIR